MSSLKVTASDASSLQALGLRYFLARQQRCSPAFTTYQTGKLFLVGRKSASGAGVPTSEADQALSIIERTYNHCMGMCASPYGRTIWLSSWDQIWRMEQALANAVPSRPFESTTTDGDDANQPPLEIILFTAPSTVASIQTRDLCADYCADGFP